MKLKSAGPELGQKLSSTQGKKDAMVVGAKGGQDEALLTVAKDFSSLFFDTVLQSMRKSVVKSDFLNGGHAEEMYQSMLDSEYAKMIAASDQSGLAKMIADQLGTLTKDKRPSSPSAIRQDHGRQAYRMARQTVK